MSYDSKVSCKYGAPMGRSSDCHDPKDLAAQVVGKVHLRYMPLDSGGYDKGGAYWGHGARLYCAWGYTAEPEGFEVSVYFRACDRKAAKAKLVGCTFYDGSGATAEQREMMRKVALKIQKEGDQGDLYCVVVGEKGSEQGHIVAAGNDEGRARRQMRKSVAEYGGDGWGRVEVCRENGTWERLEGVNK